MARGQQAIEQSGSLFPFVLPWDDTSPSITNLSTWLHRPAGTFGPLQVGSDGHLYAGGQRLRFFGVNLCFGACFPRKEDAEKIAGRMAKFGINIVRFHHMDMQTFPNGIRARDKAHTRDLDPEALDRLDYLIAQCKRHGIYVNVNLLVSRPFNAADGLPEDIEQLDWKVRHTVGFSYAPIGKLQKEYARNLLTHRNPYTGMTYAEDPAVAFIEINNENGLIQAWLGGEIDQWPSVFLSDLQQQWNEWLQKRYGTTDTVRRVWNVHAEPLGDELLVNADLSQGLEQWVLEQHAGAEAEILLTDDIPEHLRRVHPASSAPTSARIQVTGPGAQGWHVQFHQPGLQFRPDQPYTLTFWAKADRPSEMTVAITQAHEPWRELGFAASVPLTTTWQRVHFTLQLSQGDTNARLLFTNLARQVGTYELTGISLRSGGLVGLDNNEQVEDRTVPVFFRSHLGERTAEAQRDWIRFLWETEDQYWQTMYRYLKEELNVQALIMGTIVGCSTPNLMAKLDGVDTHAYWQHPSFPVRPWDPEHWLVQNRSMVDEQGGTLPRLAQRRVLNTPHSVTEYNHSAPNTYSSEAFLLLAAYAALQDWDAIYAFAYAHRRDQWDTQRIPSFFDIDQHPTKMVTLIPAVAMFVRGDVTPAQRQIVVALDKEREVEVLRHGRAWELVHAGHLGVPPQVALVHRVAIAIAGQHIPAMALRPDQVQWEDSRFVSDTGELVWDVTESGRGVVRLNASKSKAIIGFGGGKRFDLDGIRIEPGKTLQNGWCAITLTVMKGEAPSSGVPQPAHLLLTATGYAENTAMGWKTPEKSSVGSDWGQSPSLVEGIPVRITLPFSPNRVQAWALDERGGRKRTVAIQDEADKTVLALGEPYQTLWYEIEIQ